ncbi:MAG: DNA-binding transcriptional regulator [Nibricoccus sp.]
MALLSDSTRPPVLLVFLFFHEETAAMLRGIAHYQRSHRPWRTYIDDEAKAEKDPRWLRGQKWSGVISRHTHPALVEQCAAQGIPLVDLNDCEPFGDTPKIRPDNVAVGHMGAEHLLNRGFRKLVYAGFSNCLWSRERRDGFVEAARLASVESEVFDLLYPGDMTPAWEAEQVTALAGWLRKQPKPIGLMACNDMWAFTILSACAAAGLLVPEDIAVLGVNNDEVRCDLSFPPLSSVATDVFQSGYQAAEMLDLLMNGQTPTNRQIRIEPRGVITRQSTDIFAIEDRHVAAALSYIREHAFDGMSVDDLIRPSGASRSQLEKKFRRCLGRSPQTEIRRVQMERVSSLLTSTDFPLKKIADLAGFEHLEYMSVVFKRTFGVSPGQFRKRHLTKPLPRGAS